MTSPAKRHFARVRAEREAAAAASGDTQGGATRQELMLAKLASDRARLSAVQSAERKAEVKRELLPEYADYVAGVLAGGRGAQDDVLATVLVWRIDAGDYAGALEIAAYAIGNKLKLPDQFARPLAVAVAEEFADAALRALQQPDGTFDAQLLAQVGELTEGEDMPDQVRAKLLKAYGLALKVEPLELDTRWRYAAALKALQRAAELNANAGVKQEIGRIEKALAKLDAQHPQNPAQPDKLAGASGGDAAGT